MTKQRAEQADLVTLADDLKYKRFGYLNQNRNSDKLLAVFKQLVYAEDVLPKRWKYGSLTAFLKKYGHLGAVLWAESASAHLLMVGGFHALRIWTDATKACYVDVTDALSGILLHEFKMKSETIPESNKRKSKPLTKRVKCSTPEHMENLAKALARVYGICNTSV